MSKRTLLTTFFAVITMLSMAQKGTLRGTIYEGETGFIYGVQVLIKETATGAVASMVNRAIRTKYLHLTS